MNAFSLETVSMLDKPETSIRVVLVDDHVTMRTGLRMLIESHPGITVVAEASNRSEALAVVANTAPNVILLDLDLGEEKGLELLPELFDIAPEAKILLLTGVRDPEAHRRGVLMGAMGVVLKSQPAEVMIKAIEKVSIGEVWLDRSMIAQILSDTVRPEQNQEHKQPEQTKIALLTEREREVVALIGQGVKNKQIAGHLSISEATVRHHLTSIFGKLNISDRFELAIYAYKHGLAKLPK